MGLRDDIQTDIAEAFDTDLADAVKSLVLIDRKGGAYNPYTGDIADAETRTATRGTVSSYTALETMYSGGAIDINDSKILILANEVSVVPITDNFVEVTGEEYRILGVKVDPADAAYILHTRKS